MRESEVKSVFNSETKLTETAVVPSMKFKSFLTTRKLNLKTKKALKERKAKPKRANQIKANQGKPETQPRQRKKRSKRAIEQTSMLQSVHEAAAAMLAVSESKPRMAEKRPAPEQPEESLEKEARRRCRRVHFAENEPRVVNFELSLEERRLKKDAVLRIRFNAQLRRNEAREERAAAEAQALMKRRMRDLVVVNGSAHGTKYSKYGNAFNHEEADEEEDDQEAEAQDQEAVDDEDDTDTDEEVSSQEDEDDVASMMLAKKSSQQQQFAHRRSIMPAHWMRRRRFQRDFQRWSAVTRPNPIASCSV